MSTLKSAIFKTLKNSSTSVIRNLEQYLITKSEDNDRAINVNAPSQIGKCLRERYYGRIGAEKDSNSITPRSQRIFDNGTHVHLRLQEYLIKQGMLLMDEVPVLDPDCNIQGHTDGILQLPKGELAILEIKSINLKGFSALKDIKPEHMKQGLIYAHCIERRRKELHKKYNSVAEFNKDKKSRDKYFSKFYTHLKDGTFHSAESKRDFQLALHDKLDRLLLETEQPVKTVVFLYECKDDQELKEFYLSATEPRGIEITTEILKECRSLNKYVDSQKEPPREGSSPNDNKCRWCEYKIECWGQ